MQVHDLAPAPGATKNPKRVGRGTGGKGGKTAGRGTKGQRARNTVARGFEGGQMPLKQRVPKLKGFNNPFRVEYTAVNLAQARRSRREARRCRPHDRRAGGERAGAQGRLRQGARPRRDLHARSTCTPTACRRRLKPRSSLRAVRSRSSSCRSRRRAAPVARLLRATSSPTADVRSATSVITTTSDATAHTERPTTKDRQGAPRVFSSVANIFKISDLRNKILFVVAMVGVYRLGVFIRVPGVDSIAIEQLRDTANQQGALGFLNLFSGGAFESFSIFALGIMPYITASIIMQVLGVVIPKLEELQQEGAVGQRKITQYTRYVTIGLATLQATGLVFIFGTGRGTAYFGAGGERSDRSAAARRRVAARLPDHPGARRRHRRADVDLGVDLPARHRQRHVDDHLRLGGVVACRRATTASWRSTRRSGSWRSSC